MSNPTRLFEHLVTSALSALIAGQPPERVESTTLDGELAPEKLARHVAHEVTRVLASIKGDGPDRVARQAAITNSLLAHLQALSAADTLTDELVTLPPRLLLSLHDGQPPARTALPFSVSTLLTRAKGEPALGHELARELATADTVDALVSFVTMGGVRAIREALLARSAAGRPLRLLTTTYMGNTEAAALEWLARLPGVDVRISYDARRTRLHAKAWLFSRQSGLDTAYVGSANLSSSALFEGHEWMLKATCADMPAVIEKFRGTFETLWCDPEFEPYDPARDADTTRLRAALADERGGRRGVTALRTFFTLKPYPFQAEILDRLAAERRWLLMLAYQLFHERDRRFTVESFASLLAAHPAVVSDLQALTAVLLDEALVRGGDAGGALTVHARYGRREVLTALGRWHEEAKPDSREGVVRLEAEQTELLFVTLDKGEKRFSPTTSYHDYALGASRFHWQTQSLVSPTSPSGRRYVEQAANGWRFLLFVRETVNDVYTYLGPVRYAGHTGSKPMNITWELESPIPGRWLTSYALLAS